MPNPGTDTIGRYVVASQRPGRYLRLLSGRLDPGLLRDNARAISDEELTFLLQPGRRGDWRPRLVAAYLIALDRRAGFRDVIGDLLLDSQVCYSGQGYCFALAAFGTGRDAEILTAYLERYLPRIDLRYDQAWALGALLHLDERLGSHHAERFRVPDGLWDRWAAGHSNSPSADRGRQSIEALCAL
jgi:hypothetical protein